MLGEGQGRFAAPDCDWRFFLSTSYSVPNSFLDTADSGGAPPERFRGRALAEFILKGAASQHKLDPLDYFQSIGANSPTEDELLRSEIFRRFVAAGTAETRVIFSHVPSSCCDSTEYRFEDRPTGHIDVARWARSKTKVVSQMETGVQFSVIFLGGKHITNIEWFYSRRIEKALTWRDSVREILGGFSIEARKVLAVPIPPLRFVVKSKDHADYKDLGGGVEPMGSMRAPGNDQVLLVETDLGVLGSNRYSGKVICSSNAQHNITVRATGSKNGAPSGCSMTFSMKGQIANVRARTCQGANIVLEWRILPNKGQYPPPSDQENPWRGGEDIPWLLTKSSMTPAP